jgi:orotate phosphoribosyltransferase
MLVQRLQGVGCARSSKRGQGELSAIQEVQKELEIPVHALITMKDLMDYLDAKGEKALANMQAYREKYGI